MADFLDPQTTQTDPYAEFGGKVSTPVAKGDPYSEFGGSVVQKKSSVGSPPTSPPLSNGSNPSPNTQASTDPLQAYWQHLSADEQKSLSKGTQQSQQLHAQQKITVTPQSQQADYNYSQTLPGKIQNSVTYLAQKVTKGTVQVAKGAAYLADMGIHPQNFITGNTDPNIQKASDVVDNATNFLPKGSEARVEDSKAMANLGGLAEFMPAMAVAGPTGGASLYLQGFGQAKEQVDQLEKQGNKLNPMVKNAFILGSGAVNGFLMGEAGSSIFKSLSSGLKNDVVASITANAIKEAAGKDITAAEFNNLLKQGAKTWQDKTLQAGANYLENTKHAIVNLGALNVANFAIKKGVDVANDQPVFNETPGNLADELGNTIKTGAVFGAAGSLRDVSKLMPFSQYKNAVVDGLVQDSSPENIAKTKQFITDHGMQQGWSPDEINATNAHIDELANITKSIPKNLSPDKASKAVDLITGRNLLQKQLGDEIKNRSGLAEPFNGQPSAGEQLITDKIAQANDKLLDLANNTTTTYSKEKDDKGEETGKFFKTTWGKGKKSSGKREEITESRYKLETTERDAKPNFNEQTQTNTQLPVEAPKADASGETAGTDTDETTENNQITINSNEDGKNEMGGKPSRQESGQSRNEGDGSKKGGENGEESSQGSQKDEVGVPGAAKTKPGTYKPGQKLYNEDGDEFLIRSEHDGVFSVQKTSDPNKPLVGATAEDLDKQNLSTSKPIDITPDEPTISKKETVDPENTITVKEVMDKPIIYHGEPAKIVQEGQTLVAKIKDSNREYELGNVDDIGDKSIKYLGIEHQNSVVNTDEDGNIIVRGKKLINNYSDPLMAINHDNNGNVISVNLETPDGAKRTFKGDVAEDIAYQIHLKEINKDNATKQQFEDFAENDKHTKSAIVAGENEITAKKSADKNNEPVPIKPKESSQKPVNQEGSSAPVPKPYVEPKLTPEDVAHVVTDIQSSKPKEPTAPEKPKPSEKAKALADKIRALKINKTAEDIKKSNLHGGLQGLGTAVYDGALETAATVVEQGGKLADAIQAAVAHIKANSKLTNDDEIKAAIAKDLQDAGIVDDQEQKATYGTKNAITADLQQGLGLPPIEIPKDRSDDESLAAWKNGTRTPLEIISALLDPDTNIYDKSITPNDEPIMREYIRQMGERTKELNQMKVYLDEKAVGGDEQAKNDAASVSQQINNHLDEYNNALNASKVGGNIWHKYGDERQKAIDDQGLILNAIERIKNIYGTDIPADVKAKLDDLQKKHDELEAKNELLEKKIKDQQAQKNIVKAKSPRTILGTKRLTDVEFTKAKTDIIGDLKKAWKKSFASSYLTLPGVPQFNAIAPHIGKLIKLYADRGITKLDDVISGIHGDLKDDLNGITKDDVRDIIAGRYSASKPLSELQKQVNELRVQARNKAKIEELEKGIIAKTKSKGEASPEVKALQKQVAELKKQVINTYAEASAEELRKQALTIKKQIEKGEFFKQPEVKKQFANDPQWLKNNKEKADLMYQLRKMEKEAMDSKKSSFMRKLDWGNRWGRRAIFFGARTVYAHLASSVALGAIPHRLPENIIGRGLKGAFPNLMREAPIEGYLNASTEATWYGRLMNMKQTAINSWQIAKTGDTQLSKELSTRPHENVIPFLDVFSTGGHIMIKDPLREATYFASLKAHMNFYEAHGIDGTHPLLLEAARQAAWKRAEYEIFQNSPKKANIIKTYFNGLEKKGIANQLSDSRRDRIAGNAQYAASSIYNFFVPINTVPQNMLGRSMLAFRLPDRIWKAMEVNNNLKKGIDKLSNDEKDLLVLHLKKGAIGAFYWTAGALLAGSAAGGLYTKYYSNKDREDPKNNGGTDPEADYMHLFGGDINKDWQHNYQAQAFQQGATWGMVKNHYVNDEDNSWVTAQLKALTATSGAAANEIPTVNMANSLHEAISNPRGGDKFVKDLKRRVGVSKVNTLLNLVGFGSDEDE